MKKTKTTTKVKKVSASISLAKELKKYQTWHPSKEQQGKLSALDKNCTIFVKKIFKDIPDCEARSKALDEFYKTSVFLRAAIVGV